MTDTTPEMEDIQTQIANLASRARQLGFIVTLRFEDQPAAPELGIPAWKTHVINVLPVEKVITNVPIGL